MELLFPMYYSGYMQGVQRIWFLRSFFFVNVCDLVQDVGTLNDMLTTVMTPSFQTDRSGQTVQTQIRLLLEEPSDQGLHCLLFHLHLFGETP